jgi:tRNA threonylcarbamoyl adenosine modification protein (Sua5/YciO/YrdC/YwlC family)
MLQRINPDNPQENLIHEAVACLRDGGVIIYPTDTFYALGCDIQHKKAVEKLCRIKGVDPEKAQFSCICEDMRTVGEYCRHVSTPMYKIMKRAFPGPYTFVLEASRKVPRHFQTRKTLGVRIPGHPVPLMMLHHLAHPIASMSVDQDDDDPDYGRDPDQIWDRYASRVDLMLSGGYGNYLPSTVIDMSRGEDDIVVLREGMGELALLGLIAG